MEAGYSRYVSNNICFTQLYTIATCTPHLAKAESNGIPQYLNHPLSTVVKSLNVTHSLGSLIAQDIQLKGAALMATICNGRQAGGGQILAENAYINDGLLDVFLILSFPLADMAQVF